MDKIIQKDRCDAFIKFDSEILEKYKLPDFKKLEYFEYRDQFYDSDAFMDLQEWSKFVAKYVNNQNEQIRVCFNGLVDKVSEAEKQQIEILNQFINEIGNVITIQSDRINNLDYKISSLTSRSDRADNIKDNFEQYNVGKLEQKNKMLVIISIINFVLLVGFFIYFLLK